MSQSKAVVATIKLGTYEFEGLMMPNGTYRVAVSQIANLNLIPHKNASRDLKTLLGKGFTLLPVKSAIHPKAVNTVSVSEFNQCLILLSAKGCQEATDILLALADLSLTEVFSDAFGQKVDSDTRTEFLKARLFGKQGRRKFTDAVKSYQSVAGSMSPLDYSKATNLAYVLLFGKSAKQLESELGKPVRDNLSPEDLHRLELLETLATKILDKQQCEPCQAVRDAYNLLN